jgi:hypothetical protein
MLAVKKEIINRINTANNLKHGLRRYILLETKGNIPYNLGPFIFGPSKIK